MRFEWDENKEKINKAKHKISFETAKLVFDDEYRIEKYDFKNSISEDRYITIGEIHGQLLLVFVSYTERGDAVRIISARRATKTERSEYYDR